MTFEEKKASCKEFISNIANVLKGQYEVMPSCNKDESLYIVPFGTSDQVTYHSKPIGSLRYSDHWNWYANLNKCEDPRYIQCYSVDAPWARKRTDHKATRPIFAIQVCVFGKDRKYHHIFGDKFDRKTKTWSWFEPSIEEALALL